MTEKNTLVDTETTGDSTPENSEKTASLISIDEFFKTELKVGQVREAQKIEKSNKLLRLQVDVGDADGPRQIIAGIAKSYTAEQMLGRKVVIVANLKPAKLMGELSNGMVLATRSESGEIELVVPGEASTLGASVG